MVPVGGADVPTFIAYGVEKNLDRYTIVMVIIWLACIVALNLIQAYAV